ncbi:hypothetical protein FGM00_06865 [Aggregatimonas sangjinii]|uniref:Uncharacterized protein n=1 Tax=Aggregatimonas sangjinii TaxID=2583587 RepID=A0A5B7SS70_9FLAO|nr:hypothetical protein [Aggregatimonas sangjinii]QCW99830.1 hypothetical protein FGM00_06865 [Aggregatimonas sangjinii]
MKRLILSHILIIFLVVISTYSCSEDAYMPTDAEEEVMEEESETEDDASTDEETGTEDTTCSDPSNYIFSEKDGLVLVEFENAEFSADWALKSDGDGHSGAGYMVWEGQQHLSIPGNGTATFKINITNPGTYQFLWNSAVKTGDNGTDHNDTWLRFNDAQDFYAQNTDGTSTVYPKGIDKTPNPEGASADGWFKIYRSGNNLDFKWQASTFDNNPHNIFVQFDSAGTYLMEISARSSGHGIDKFVLFNDSVTQANAISSNEESVISCD